MKTFSQYIYEENFLEEHISKNNVMIEEGIIKSIKKLFKKIFNIKPKDDDKKKYRDRQYYNGFGYGYDGSRYKRSSFDISVKDCITKVNDLNTSDLTSEAKYQLISFDVPNDLIRVINKCTPDIDIKSKDDKETTKKQPVIGFPRFKEYIQNGSLKGANRIYYSCYIEKNASILPCVAVMIVDRVDDTDKKTYNLTDIEFIEGLNKDLQKSSKTLEKNIITKLIKSLKFDGNENGEIILTYDSDINVKYNNSSLVEVLKETGFKQENNGIWQQTIKY